jgi:hypothetical protein
MVNRTFVCFDCKVSRRASAAGGKLRSLRCSRCAAALVELPLEARIPKRDDDAGWKQFGVYLARREEELATASVPIEERTPKGVRSLFQLPGRKRK